LNHRSLSSPYAPAPKITAWRLLNSSVILVFGISKAVSTYLGYSSLPTTLDWILGVMWVLMYVLAKLPILLAAREVLTHPCPTEQLILGQLAGKRSPYGSSVALHYRFICKQSHPKWCHCIGNAVDRIGHRFW
jgi:hypothetical protein